MTGTISTGRTEKTMKCKARWLSSKKLWQVWCNECSTYAWHTKPDGSTYLPEDIAIGHYARYHKE